MFKSELLRSTILLTVLCACAGNLTHSRQRYHIEVKGSADMLDKFQLLLRDKLISQQERIKTRVKNDPAAARHYLDSQISSRMIKKISRFNQLFKTKRIKTFKTENALLLAETLYHAPSKQNILILASRSAVTLLNESLKVMGSFALDQIDARLCAIQQSFNRLVIFVVGSDNRLTTLSVQIEPVVAFERRKAVVLDFQPTGLTTLDTGVVIWNDSVHRLAYKIFRYRPGAPGQLEPRTRPNCYSKPEKQLAYQ